MTKQELRALAEAACATHPITRLEKGHGTGLTARQWTKIVQQPGKTSLRERDPQREFAAELAAELAAERAHERRVQQRWEELHGAR